MVMLQHAVLQAIGVVVPPFGLENQGADLNSITRDGNNEYTLLAALTIFT